jgi:hypothetical protein
MAQSEKRRLERTITFRLPAEVYDRYAGIAAAEGRSIGATVRQRLLDAEPTLTLPDEGSGKRTRRPVTVEELERLAAAASRLKAAKPDKTPDSDEAREGRRRLLFLANKTSNNMNQLAHRANAAHQAGTIDKHTYEAILYELQSLSDAMKKGVGDAG